MSRNEEFHAQHLSVGIDTGGPIEGHVVVHASHPDHGEVGFLELGKQTEQGRRVMDIQVHPNFQRKGVATRLWRHAHESGLSPQHSSERTDAGDAWAKKVGGEIPPRGEVW